MVSNLIFVMSNLDNWGNSTSSGTQSLVQISLYSTVIRSKEVNRFTTLELFELDYKHPTILFQNDNSKFFNDILRKIENIVARALSFAIIKYSNSGSPNNQK